MILGDKLQHGGALVIQQHFFLVPSDAVGAHAETFTDLFVGQAFPDKQEYLFATRGKMKSGNSLYRWCYLLEAHHVNNPACADFFANVGKMIAKGTPGNEQFLYNGF